MNVGVSVWSPLITFAFIRLIPPHNSRWMKRIRIPNYLCIHLFLSSREWLLGFVHLWKNDTRGRLWAAKKVLTILDFHQTFKNIRCISTCFVFSWLYRRKKKRWIFTHEHENRRISLLFKLRSGLVALWIYLFVSRTQTELLACSFFYFPVLFNLLERTYSSGNVFSRVSWF